MNTNKIFRNIHINEFAGELVINAIVSNKNKKLKYNLYIRSAKQNLNEVSTNSIHLEEDKMDVTLIPNSDVDALPFSFTFIGSWGQLINNIKTSLLNLSRKEESKYLNLSLSLDDVNTKHYIFVKTNNELKSHFTQVMTYNDPNFIKVEEVVKQIKDINNKETLGNIETYIYDALVAPVED